ncbi:hypothetical protein RHGRI_035844 [Rhododendron griersonianum]|uniref:Transmembrane protein n=1 Tax=Rhododendron griersonianum TaxID=479676 RepID=A0AAV6HL56_9ERIC|nr:hypothetical protein RHGRI_035844 [Rhododendron griersonianum]
MDLMIPRNPTLPPQNSPIVSSSAHCIDLLRLLFPKSCSVRHLVSSVGHNIVDWDCDNDDDDEEEEEEPKMSYSKVPSKSYKKASITTILRITIVVVGVLLLSYFLCCVPCLSLYGSNYNRGDEERKDKNKFP